MATVYVDPVCVKDSIDMPYIKKPLAKALYEVWKSTIERMRKGGKNEQATGNKFTEKFRTKFG